MVGLNFKYVDPSEVNKKQFKKKVRKKQDHFLFLMKNKINEDQKDEILKNKKTVDDKIDQSLSKQETYRYCMINVLIESTHIILMDMNTIVKRIQNCNEEEAIKDLVNYLFKHYKELNEFLDSVIYKPAEFKNEIQKQDESMKKDYFYNG